MAVARQKRNANLHLLLLLWQFLPEPLEQAVGQAWVWKRAHLTRREEW